MHVAQKNLREDLVKEIIAKELYQLLNENDLKVEMVGNEETLITGFSSLKNYKIGTLTWIGKQISEHDSLKFTAAILPIDWDIKVSVKFICQNDKYLFFKACRILADHEDKYTISQLSSIDHTAQIGKNVSVGHYSCIGKNVQIGDNTVIETHVTIYNETIIGQNCVIKSGAVIGGRGFGYSKIRGRYIAIPHYGRTIIGDNVDVGSNTCIDCGTIDDTVISEGVKIDNLCHIAHNVIIGKNSMIIANSMIAGSVQIGDNAYVAPSSSIINKAKIGNNALCGIGTVVLHNVGDNEIVAGVPAKKIRFLTEEDRKKY